jgi:UDP-GlcNAc:undecaprenyl-phosphate GlcNAc-1-phosphate transferase
MFFNLTFVISFFVFSFAFAILINYLLLRLSRTLGIRDLDDKMVRWAASQKPALGGISFYIIFLLSIIFYTQFINPGSVFRDFKFLGIISSISLGFLMGLADDAYNTKPFLKFVSQLLCGLILVITGTSIHLFNNSLIDGALTVFWIIGIMNSINMLDNMDSITTSVSLFIIVAFLIIGAKNAPFNIYFVIMIGVFAALIAFLKFNWHPSRMFMGDTGSQFLGAFLGAMGIMYLWNPPEGEALSQGKQITLIALAFLLPIVDTTSVTINRLLKGKSPFVGGRDHTTHHLSYLGLTDRQVAMAFIGISSLSVIFIFYISYFVKEWSYLHTLIFILYCLIVFIVLYSITRYSKPKPKS